MPLTRYNSERRSKPVEALLAARLLALVAGGCQPAFDLRATGRNPIWRWVTRITEIWVFHMSVRLECGQYSSKIQEFAIYHGGGHWILIVTSLTKVTGEGTLGSASLLPRARLRCEAYATRALLRESWPVLFVYFQVRSGPADSQTASACGIEQSHSGRPLRFRGLGDLRHLPR